MLWENHLSNIPEEEILILFLRHDEMRRLEVGWMV